MEPPSKASSSPNSVSSAGSSTRYKVQMVDRRIGRIAVPERERGAAHGVRARTGLDDGTHERRFAGAQRTGKSDDFARAQAASESGRERAKLVLAIKCSIHRSGEI